MVYIKKNCSKYCYTANHETLTRILQDNQIKLKLPGDCYHGFSCYPDRNNVIILDEIAEERLQELEDEYINYLIEKGAKRLQPIPGTDQFFIMIKKLNEIHGHAEPIRVPQNIIWIGRANCHGGDPDSEREDYFMDIDKITVQRHINIYLPKSILKCWCIGIGGRTVQSVERKLCERFGFQVFLHYHYFSDTE